MLLQADATANAEIFIEDGSEALTLDGWDHPDDTDVLTAALLALVEDLIAAFADDWSATLDGWDHPDDTDVLTAALLALVEDLIPLPTDADGAAFDDSDLNGLDPTTDLASAPLAGFEDLIPLPTDADGAAFDDSDLNGNGTDADLASAPLAGFEDLIPLPTDADGAAFDDSDLNGLDPILNWDLLYDAELADLIEDLIPFLLSADELMFDGLSDGYATGSEDAGVFWLGIDDDTLLVFLEDGSVYAATDLENDIGWVAVPILLNPTSIQPPDVVAINVTSTVSGVIRSVLAVDQVSVRLIDFATVPEQIQSVLAADIVAVQMAIRSYLGSLRLTDALTSPNDKLKKPDKATLQ